MSPDQEGRLRQVLADQSAHPSHLEQIRLDRADSDDVILPGPDLLDEAFLGGKVQKHARSAQIDLNQHEPPGTMKGAQRERLLHPCHLVVVQLHGVDETAAVGIILSVRTEDAGQQHSRAGGERMYGLF